MTNEQNPLLKLTFAERAQIGIGLPHDGYEVPLMLAGKKPCLIAPWPLNYIKNGGEDYTQLEPAIQSGQLVLIGTYERLYPYHIIAHPHYMKAIEAISLIAGRKVMGQQSSWEEFESYERFVSVYCGIKMRDERGQFAFEDYNNRIKSQGEEDYNLLLKGLIRSTLAVRTGTDFNNCPLEVQEKLATGELCAVHAATQKEVSAILAQRDCVNMGQELFARYWHGNKGYKPLEGPEFTKRIGHLLGYTPADTEFFMTTGRKNPTDHTDEEKNIIASFEMLRRERAKYLLGNAP